MARLIVGLARSAVADDGVDDEFTLDMADGRTLGLASQHLESEGISWYWADVDDDEDPTGLLEALLATPGVASSYLQPPDAAP
jgi:hypothetical protein